MNRAGLIEEVGPQYSPAPLGRRHAPWPSRPHDEYRACLRLDFSFRCVYCLSLEVEVAKGAAYGSFEIEHFKPEHRFRGLRNVYTNLLWACPACNRAKKGTWPTEEDVERGARFVDPSAEALGDHLRIVGHMVEAVGGSPAGEFMITELYLNSKLHLNRRREREKLEEQIAVFEGLCQQMEDEAGDAPENAAARTRAAAFRQQLETLRREHLQPAIPWDAPDICRFRCGRDDAPVRPRRLTRRQRKGRS